MSKKIIQINDLTDAFSYISNLSCIVGVKDLNSTFKNVSDYGAKLFGWKSLDEAINRTDHDLPCKASELAERFIEVDQKVIETKSNIKTLEILHYPSGWQVFLGEKTPILGPSGEVIGIYFHDIDISSSHLCGYGQLINSHDKRFKSTQKQSVAYVLSSSTNCPLPITPKQQECLFLLTRGKATKEISYILDISVRTVECHIDEMKTRLSCQTKSQMIEKAIESGFLYYIPQSLIRYGIF